MIEIFNVDHRFGAHGVPRDIVFNVTGGIVSAG